MDLDNGASQVDVDQVGTSSGGRNPVEEVLGNHLIWKTIGCYLNMVDLLTCRMVNSGFHAMVMKETKFLDGCLVSLEPHQITSDVFGSTVEPWKNVELKFGNPAEETKDFHFDDDELEWLYPVVSNVESLSLKMEVGTNGGDFYEVLKHLLNAPKKLGALAIEPIFLRARTRDINDWNDTFEDLEEFQVLKPPEGWQNDIDDWVTNQCWDDTVFFSFTCKMKNIKVLRSFYPNEPISVSPDDEEFILARFERFLLPQLLSRIASGNASTLKRVTLFNHGTWIQENPDDSTEFYSFPSLESATFNVEVQFGPFVKYYVEIIKNNFVALPMLKELDFAIFPILPNSILNAIGERSGSLRTLTILSSDFRGTNWQFLKHTKIETFELGLIESEVGGETLPDEALSCLPPIIQKLVLMGRLESNPIPALARLNPSLVKKLTFMDCGDCFTDDTVKYIRENFKMLRSLKITDAKQVTDAGFVASSESGSFSGIKGLKNLVLEECGSITDATLREILFLELCHLEISYYEGVTDEGWEEMLRNNPSLMAQRRHQSREDACLQ